MRKYSLVCCLLLLLLCSSVFAAEKENIRWYSLFEAEGYELSLDTSNFISNLEKLDSKGTYEVNYWIRYQKSESPEKIDQNISNQINLISGSSRHRIITIRVTSPEGTHSKENTTGWERILPGSFESKLLQAVLEYDKTRVALKKEQEEKELVKPSR